MQASAADMHTDSVADTEREEPIRIWVESGDGSISRGLIDLLSTDGACVRLISAAPLRLGKDVAVRISFSRSTPTLGASARVLRLRPSGEITECELEWTHSGPGREQLALRVASLS
jgi:hypothetical protein